MIGGAIALSLAAAAVHAIWNVLIKATGDPITTFRRATIAAAVVATALAVPAWFWQSRPALPLSAAGLCFLSATLETTYLWLLSAAYRRGELSVVYPIARGTAPLIAVVIGFGLYRERLAALQLAGVIVLLLGILAVSVSQVRGKATLPAFLTGVAIAGYASVDRLGTRLTQPWLYAWLLFTLIAIELTVSLWIASRLRLRADGSDGTGWAEATAIGLLIWGGYTLVLWALSFAPLALVAPVREVAIVAVSIWGVWRLGERQRLPLKLGGAMATVAGVALLAG